MNAYLLASFSDELVKLGLGIGTLRSYLGARAAQGVGGAGALAQALPAAQTTRQAVKGMSGLQKHRLSGVLQGGRDVRAMQRLPQKVGLGPEAQQMRQRVGTAIKQEAAGAPSRGSIPLSKGYEGYMTRAQTAYTPQHIEQVMGLKPGQHVPKAGPTALMKPKPKLVAAPADVTVPSASRVRKKRVDPLAATEISDVTKVTGPPKQVVG